MSVILVGQRSLVAQRRGRYVAASGAHPARMAPDLAATLITDYTNPCDLVFDPLAGTGTTLVEAAHLGRNALGMEIEPGWVTIARANLALARRQGARSSGKVILGDATRLPTRIPTRLRGTLDLVLTSPPYGPTMHGRVQHRHGPLTRFNNTYSTSDRQNTGTAVNLANAGRRGLADGIRDMLAGCVPLLKSGGIVAVVARPWRRNGYLIDIPGQIINGGLDAGLDLIDCRHAVHAALRNGLLQPRHSFFQLVETRKARAKGIPASLTQHDEIVVFQKRSIFRKSDNPQSR
jgi:hypothetical protein